MTYDLVAPYPSILAGCNLRSAILHSLAIAGAMSDVVKLAPRRLRLAGREG